MESQTIVTVGTWTRGTLGHEWGDAGARRGARQYAVLSTYPVPRTQYPIDRERAHSLEISSAQRSNPPFEESVGHSHTLDIEVIPLDGTERSLQLFLNGFSARDLAESLRSFDDSAFRGTILAEMDAKGWEVVGIRQQGVMAGWITRQDVVEHFESFRPFEVTTLITDDASLADVVRGLSTAAYLFVNILGQVQGVISRRDLEKPAMRMWLFGLVTITELRITTMIEECCPDDSWKQFLSEGRLQLAAALQKERGLRGQRRSLLDCLQFADKGRIFARHEILRGHSPFPSRRAVEDFVKSLQDLRNNLAHSQEIAGDWNVIFDLANNLHRVVLGPRFQPSGTNGESANAAGKDLS